MARTLVTGGTGFVGRYLARSLRGRGHDVFVVAAGTYSEPEPGVTFCRVDLRERDSIHRVIRDFRPNYIYHLAAVSSVGLSWDLPRLTYEVNVLGTLNVLEAATGLPASPRILNVSTAQVYAPSSSILREESPISPGNPYAASKLMAEWLQVQFRKRPEIWISTARSFNHTGPGQSANFVISSIAKQFAEIEAGGRDPKLLLGNVHVKRDFTDVRDVVQAYSLLLERGTSNATYNVCSGQARSIAEIVQNFNQITGIEVEIETDASKCRAGEVELVCGNPAKIRRDTGWEPSTPWETTLRDLLNHWRNVLGHKVGSVSGGDRLGQVTTAPFLSK